MKKSIILLLGVVLLNSCSNENSGEVSTQNYSKDTTVSRGWQIAGADAAGALGGAGSVAGVAAWFGWTPAAPIAAGVVLVGALIGGVGTSLAVSYQVPVNPIQDLDYSFLKVEENYMDSVGFKHNQLVSDYLQSNAIFTPEQYYSFVNENAGNYDINEVSLSFEEVKRLSSEVKNLNSISELNEYTVNLLPEEVNKKKYREFLLKLNSISNKNQAIAYIKEFEISELGNESYKGRTKVLLGSFFSTYRYSLALWY